MAGGVLSGNGTAISPFLIEDREDLIVGLSYVGSGFFFKQIANIDMLGIPYDPKSFSHNYNGNGFKITNLYINKPNQRHVGLFTQVTSSGVVRYLDIEGIIIGKEMSGVIAGELIGTISDCIVKGHVSGGVYIGGVAGYISGSGKITKCISYAKITANAYAGGICGLCDVYKITNSIYLGTKIERTVGSNSEHFSDIAVNGGSQLFDGCYSLNTLEFVQL